MGCIATRGWDEKTDVMIVEEGRGRVGYEVKGKGSHTLLAGDVSHKPGGIGCHCFPPVLQLPSQPLKGLLPIWLLGEQRRNGCEQFV